MTGGAGFIGSHLAELLIQKGCRVRVLDSLITGSLENLARIWDQIEFLQGDIRDRPALRQALAGVRTVFHLAALASVPQSIREPELYLEVNGLGTLYVLEEAARAGAGRAILASTSAVYGDGPSPSAEGQVPQADNPYAASKLLAENLALFHEKHRSLQTAALRLFNVYGPRQALAFGEGSVIPLFVEAARRNQAPDIFGGGDQTRDFIEVRDAVQAFLQAGQLTCLKSGVYNVGTGQGVSINSLCRLLRELRPQMPKPQYRPARPGDVLQSAASMERTRRYLKFSAHIDLREGLAYLLDASPA
ncbi:MAG: GDP-mannose 4,6-dehydratase [Deltaproteobacteria bacterium]|nr:GDP-mannose 4,6-dehydratase [Deltaproteobacteria bacterium]